MYHEAIHKKYNDNTAPHVSQSMVMMGVMFVSYIIMFPLPVHILFKAILPNVFGLASFALLLSKKYSYEERRADVEGLYAMSCHQCVGDVSKYLKRENNNEGYLNYTEIAQIANVLKKENKLCIDHKH